MRRWLQSTATLLLLPAVFILQRDLRPQEQSVTWGCGDAAVAPPGVHLPMQPAAGGIVALGHIAAMLGLLLIAFALWNLLRLVTAAIGNRLSSWTSESGKVAAATLSAPEHPSLLSEFLLGLSVTRRGPPVLA